MSTESDLAAAQDKISTLEAQLAASNAALAKLQGHVNEAKGVCAFGLSTLNTARNTLLKVISILSK
ncbi:hypothetical protein UFOVP1325_20 [uncultured Caudovirales phage]|uniref:Uncharacterized protein n=1 Tax=uncultured Caudovirales phage TaxID=2100421 RepID=A0A6J7XAA3_9CAUD|nr:hypothetical protein UFOVP1325_20 [uncultured Caudovirales phage]CAB4212425.1 hypothetical protein UFOVP1435_10 [uncultured Caudovirales phage]CAB5228034.1 hypothetical protein UFOVP1530_41 [uncultured Caudovirales phage]